MITEIESVKKTIDYDLFKSNRTKNIKNLTVVVDNMEFDACEDSQNRLARAVLSNSSDTIIRWKLADNSVAIVTCEQLKQVLKATTDAQTSMWFM